MLLKGSAELTRCRPNYLSQVQFQKSVNWELPFEDLNVDLIWVELMELKGQQKKKNVALIESMSLWVKSVIYHPRATTTCILLSTVFSRLCFHLLQLTPVQDVAVGWSLHSWYGLKAGFKWKSLQFIREVPVETQGDKAQREKNRHQSIHLSQEVNQSSPYWNCASHHAL